MLEAHLLLVITSIDGNRLQAHSFCVLLRKRTESTAGADNGDGLARLSSRLFEALVYGDAGAENGGDCVEGDGLVDAGDVGRLCDAVLLEGAVDSIAGEEGFGAQGLVGGLAEVASQTCAVDPLWGNLSV